MGPIAAVAGQELLWAQPSRMKRAYELRAGDEILATLCWQRGSLADAEAADHQWTFKQPRGWNPPVTVRARGSDVDIAVFHRSWGTTTGSLELAPGRGMVLGFAHYWLRTEWVWLEEAGATLVHVKAARWLLKTEGRVEISPRAAGLPDTPLLVLLGWYLLLTYAPTG
jgi:hypothetical protein